MKIVFLKTVKYTNTIKQLFQYPKFTAICRDRMVLIWTIHLGPAGLIPITSWNWHPTGFQLTLSPNRELSLSHRISLSLTIFHWKINRYCFKKLRLNSTFQMSTGLLTGASGFIAMQVLKLLFKAEFKVKANVTVRSADKTVFIKKKFP